MPDRILITTDDLEHAVRINAGVEAAGFHTTLAHTLDEARQALRRDPPPDCVVVTGGLHESGAAQLLTLARDRSVSTLGLVEETEHDAKGLARRLGLTGYLDKPADPAEVAATVRRLIERRKLQQRTGIIGESPAIQEVLVKIEQMAPVSSTVLVEGESGTGKELVARALHRLSGRRNKPFIAESVAALPETLLESELFGHEKGAFTGAAERRIGRFELAPRTSRCSCAGSSRTTRRSTSARSMASARKRCRCSCAIPGRGTCASCGTSWRAWSSSRPVARSGRTTCRARFATAEARDSSPCTCRGRRPSRRRGRTAASSSSSSAR